MGTTTASSSPGPDDRRLPLARVAYDPAARSVALIPRRRLSLRQVYQVVALGDGPRGIVNLQGGALNSGPNGEAGRPYRMVVRGYGPIEGEGASQVRTPLRSGRNVGLGRRS